MKKNEFNLIKYTFYIIALVSFVYVIYHLLFASYQAGYILSRALPGAIVFLASSIASCILLVYEKKYLENK